MHHARAPAVRGFPRVPQHRPGLRIGPHIRYVPATLRAASAAHCAARHTTRIPCSPANAPLPAFQRPRDQHATLRFPALLEAVRLHAQVHPAAASPHQHPLRARRQQRRPPRRRLLGGSASRRAVNPVTGVIRVMVEVVFMGLLGSGFKVCCSRFSVLVDHSGFVLPRLPR